MEGASEMTVCYCSRCTMPCSQTPVVWVCIYACQLLVRLMNDDVVLCPRKATRLRRHLGLASLANCLHPPVFLALSCNNGLRRFIAGPELAQNVLDLRDGGTAQQRHFLLHNQGDTGSNKNGITLKDIDVPKAGGLVKRHVPSEEGNEDIA